MYPQKEYRETSIKKGMNLLKNLCTLFFVPNDGL